MAGSVYASCKVVTDEMTLIQGDAGYQLRQKFRIGGISRDADYLALLAQGKITQPLEYAINLPAKAGPLNLFDGTVSASGRSIVPPGRGDHVGMVVWATTSDTVKVELYCTGKTGKYASKSTDSVIVTCDYAEIGVPIPNVTEGTSNSSTYLWFASLQINGGTVPTRTNYEWKVDTAGTETFGSLIQAWHKPGTPGYDGTALPSQTAADVAAGIVSSQYVSVPTLEPITNLTFNCREIIHPASSNSHLTSIEEKIKYFNGSANLYPIWGFPAGTLRCRATICAVDPFRGLYIVNPDAYSVWGAMIPTGRSVLRDTSYLIEYRERGWDEIATMTDPWTGFHFPDTDQPADGIAQGKTRGNGWVKAVPLKKRDFSLLNLPDVRLL
jgi:hypothetical protein